MLGNLGILHLLVLLALIALDIVALVQIWRDPKRSVVTKIIWTLVIILVPIVGGVGWLINWSLAKATDRLNRRAAQ